MHWQRKTWTDDPFDTWDDCDFRRWSYGKGGGSAPAAPDPTATANAQAAANAETARVQARLNRVNQTTPFGSITFNDLGGDRWSSNIDLSPEQQALYNSQTRTSQGLYNLAEGAIPRLSDAMASRIDTSRLPDVVGSQGDVVAAADRYGQNIYDRGLARLQPQFERDRATTLQTLADRGIGAGSGEAWTNENRDLAQRQNDALVSLASAADQARGAEQNRLTALQQSIRQGDIQEQDYFRQQPINDIAKLLGTSSGVTTPQFTQAPQVGVAPTDVVGPINTAYQAQLANWNRQNQQNAGLMGGLFGLGGTLLGSAFGGPAGAYLGGQLGSTIGRSF